MLLALRRGFARLSGTGFDMKHEIFSAAELTMDPRLAADTGELAVGCADVGGRIEEVAGELADQVTALGKLERVTADLEADQAQVARATEEAKVLSAKAAENIQSSAQQISSTVAEFGQLTDLIERMGTHVTNFAAAMEQVKAVSASIETIAKTTNMLALNAAIEAERAGDAGRTFAVVASEVKKLASHTRAATEEIRRTVGSLSSEAEGLMREISAGVEESHRAERGFETIADALGRAIDLVGLVDGQSDQIARSASLIHGNSQQVRGALQQFGQRVRTSSEQLVDTHAHIDRLEALSNQVFHGLVASGASPDDWGFVAYATQRRDDCVAMTEKALADGTLSMAELFDVDYQLIPGSKPERYKTRLWDWAHAHWRPLLDEIAGFDSRVISSACTSKDGYLPTHLSLYSRESTGDVAHDTKYCRNGRRFYDKIDAKAKASEEPFFMAVYRREGDGSYYDVVRNVYVPLHFQGRRWGDLEISYRI